MEKKIILVTGANRGIGFEIIRQLAKLGHQTILTARNETEGTKAREKLAKEGLTVHFLKMDVTSETQISDAVSAVRNQFGHLDVLINNAGVMRKNDTSLLNTTDDILGDIIKTNSLAPLKVTQAFVPIIPKMGKVVMVSSGAGSMTDPVGGWSPVYCISKSMLNAITRHLAYYLTEKGIQVNAMCPGWVKTEMGGSGATRNVDEGADTAVWLATTENIPTGKFWRDRKEIPW